MKFWQDCLPKLQEKLGQTTFETWIAPLVLNEEKSRQSQHLVLQAPDPFFKDWILKNYLPVIESALKSLPEQEGAPTAVEIIAKGYKKPQEVKIQDFQKHWLGEKREGLILNPRFTFDDFVVGPSNRFAHAASMAVAQSPARAYNPLFIYGGVGLGKTHLMQAICHSAKTRDNTTQICYMPSERFTNELISAIQHHSTAAFRQKYRNMDILVIDDIHFIAGKESTQEEFFHTFNTLYDAHKQIIISSDRPPREIPKLEERLVSRFSWGLVTDIQLPDFETRVAILKKKVEKEPINIPDEIIFFIAQTIKTNIRELEGALIRVIACSLLEERPITMELSQEILKDFIQQTQPPITFQGILVQVADEFGVDVAELKTKKRSKNIVLPRQVAMYLSRELTEASLPEIARFFGGKDHTTILYSYNKIKKELGVNNNLKLRVNKLINIISR
ncbi:MAG: chromosomal replication initiator protein DnaA [Candidatus Omnitrophica bacterium]|nr:chromosomal replication initiator protein DnaA [Candidatus Omnitrophota bacterium]